MLSKETKETLQGLGFDVSMLEQAIKADEEVSLEVPTLYKDKGITEDEKKIFGNNRFEEGKKAMSEIKAKELKSAYGVEIEGKDLDTVIGKIVDVKVAELDKEPNERIKALQSDNDALKKNLEALTEEKSSLEQNFNNKLFNFEARNTVISSLPKEGLKISQDDLTDLFFNRHRVDCISTQTDI